MRLKIIFYCLILISVHASGQLYYHTFDTTYKHQIIPEFFAENPSVRKLSVRIHVTNGYDTTTTLTVYPKTYWDPENYLNRTISKDEYYELDFIGDRYLYNKKYTPLSFLLTCYNH